MCVSASPPTPAVSRAKRRPSADMASAWPRSCSARRADATFLVPLLDGLRTSPILGTVDASGLFAAVPPATGATRGSPLTRDAATTGNAATLTANDIRRARRQLSTLQSLTIGDNPSVTTLDERILAAQSADLRARQRSDY